MSSPSARIGLAAVVASVIVAAIFLSRSAGLRAPQGSSGSNTGIELQVPDTTVGAQQAGKQETGKPTPFPTVMLPPMTPVPLDGDKDFDASPTPGFYLPPTPLPGDPYILQVAADGVPPSVDEATGQAQLVVSGLVKQVGPARWTTSDGSRPANPHLPGNRDYIVTPVTIQVTNALKGSNIGLGAELTLQAFGGVVGQDRVEWLHDKDNLYQTGQQVIVFLVPPSASDPLQTSGNRQLWQSIERYTVDANGRARNSHSDVPAQQLLDEISRATQTLSP